LRKVAITGPRSAAVGAPQTRRGRSVVLWLGDPFAVLNGLGFMTDP